MDIDMKLPGNIKQGKFYLWVGLAYLILGLLSELPYGSDSFLHHASNEIWAALYLIVINYLFFEYILPKLSLKRIGKSLLLILIQLFLMSFGLFLWRRVGINLRIYTSFATDSSASHIVEDQMSNSVGAIFFFGIVRHIYNHIQLKQTAQQLRIEKQAAELSYLKSQTNPHFLFNTLNNIYSLARDKSDLAAESILRLSKILRFMLYEAGGAYIAIEEELKIISDYISLEKLRYDESLHINFNHDIEDMKQALPPLLLVPLVENAFKHGVSETRNQPFVEVHLSVNKRQLSFIVKNSTDDISEESIVKENIGLSNLRRQLELLYTDFSLTVNQNKSAFTTALKINLASHV